jgi:hypothetical protein
MKQLAGKALHAYPHLAIADRTPVLPAIKSGAGG